jgi:hypothetical protein
MIAKRTAQKNLDRQKVGDGYFRKEEAVLADKIQKISVSIFLTFGKLSRDMVKL